MYLAPLPRTAAACFGVGCPLHAGCARYAAVSHSQADPSTMITCLRGGTFPLFVAIGAAQPVAA